MLLQVKYIVDDKGEKTSVVVPLRDWNNLEHRYEKLANKVRILTGIKKGISEVKRARKAGKKLPTLTDFLNESRG